MVVQTTVEGCVVLLSIDDGKYYSLNRTATEIWNCLEKPASLGDIELDLAERFEVPEEGAKAFVMESIDYFKKCRLIEEV